MVSVKLTFAAALALAMQAYAATINTPTALIQCQPVQLSWSGVSGSSIFLAVLPGGQSAALPIQDFGELPASPAAYTWTVNVAAGTSVTIRLTDSTGVPAYTEQVTIQPGSASCLDGDASSAAGGATTGQSSASSASVTRSTAAASAGTTSRAANGGQSSANTAGTSTRASQSSGGAASPAQSSQPASTGSILTVGSGLLAGVAALVAIVA
ncbi:hypothetical protein OIO90_002579 [Microbotryomycetes sp. JL221]|nr:hypothetical protein OIO90_002579 [Microbotryomycetes sp. JL221]